MMFRILSSIVRRRKTIGIVTFLFFAVSLAFVLARGKIYRSNALLLPPVDESGQGILSAWMSRLNIPSVMTPISAGSTSAAILRDILESRRLGEMIVNSLSLMEHYDADNMDEAIRKLRARTKVVATQTGLIKLSVRDKEPEYCEKIAKAYISGLDSLNRYLQHKRAEDTRKFVYKQIEGYRIKLQEARDQIAAFQSAHNIVDFDEQVRGAIAVAADMKVRTILAGIERDLAKEFASEETIEFRRKSAEYENLLKQLDNIVRGDTLGAVFIPLKRYPELLQRYAEMQRDLEVNERVYAYLLERYEEAGIEQSRMTPVVQVVDEPSIPEEPVGPSRVLVVVLATLVGFLWSSFMALWWQWKVEHPRSPEEQHALEELKEILSKDISRIRRSLHI